MVANLCLSQAFLCVLRTVFQYKFLFVVCNILHVCVCTYIITDIIYKVALYMYCVHKFYLHFLRANEEFEAMRKANDQEMTKMAALLKKAEMKIMSLQDSFDRKTRENQELTQLCDDLINKVGSSH